MGFSTLIQGIDDACLGAFGLAEDGVTATFTPQGRAAQTIDGIVCEPPMEEEFLPGLSPGVAVMHLFVRFTEITPNPQRGDVVAIGARSYIVADVKVDTAGGAVLKLRTS